MQTEIIVVFHNLVICQHHLYEFAFAVPDMNFAGAVGEHVAVVVGGLGDGEEHRHSLI